MYENKVSLYRTKLLFISRGTAETKLAFSQAGLGVLQVVATERIQSCYY